MNQEKEYQEMADAIDAAIEELTKEIANSEDDDEILELSMQRDNLRLKKDEYYNEAHGL